MDLFDKHQWAASLRVIAIKGQIERHHDIRLRHVELGEDAGAEELSVRIQALEQELIFAEAIKAAVVSCAERRRRRASAMAETRRVQRADHSGHRHRQPAAAQPSLCGA